jgi:hypothetical protein
MKIIKKIIKFIIISILLLFILGIAMVTCYELNYEYPSTQFGKDSEDPPMSDEEHDRMWEDWKYEEDEDFMTMLTYKYLYY